MPITFLLTVLVVLSATATGVVALGTPFGYAAGVTGGGSATTQTPSSAAELKSWLEDTTTRRITLNQIYDFTNYWGTETGLVCFPWSCTPNPQGMINSANNWCSSYTNQSTATYYLAGTTNSNYIQVKSNKTLLGSGANTGIKGVGLRMSGGVSNIIIQNIRITDINARWVWGGDAISLDGASNVWIDHNYINRVGRQFIVTGFNTNTGITISNNFFDGTADYSTSCNYDHYWALLIAGSADRITFAYNRLYRTIGRGPHSGDYYDTIPGHAVDSDTGSRLLVEGNYFYSVTTPKTTTVTGATFFVSSSNQASCTSSLGRTCQVNAFTSSGSASASDSAVLSAVGGETAIRGFTPMAATAVANYVLANAGTGKTIT
ncbi:putative pectin lyase precursor [Flagelloscypha sp. PMI_526]|nr:putative pectin lyase precursor [Flagelloscypha sp. PMI_526]